jgi:pimeloyl-ACP methyl ester carboxylesterase
VGKGILVPVDFSKILDITAETGSGIPPERKDVRMDQIRIELPEVSLAALTWGSADGPLAVLLHGFPDTAHTWRHLGPVLADQGYRVVAPFLRGYAPSAMPADRRGDIAALVSDTLGIHRELGGGDDAVLIGHDWGAIATNALIAHEDNPFAKAVAMSVPPFTAVKPDLRALPRQVRNSWYIGFNRLPWLPERNHERLVRYLWRTWSPGYDAEADLRSVLEAMAWEDNRRLIFGYYRALVSPFGPPEHYRRWKGAELRDPGMPLLYLHGTDDGCMDVRIAASAEQNLPAGSRMELIGDAGHFLHLEQPVEVNRAIVEYLAS